MENDLLLRTRPFLFEVFVQLLHGPYFPDFKDYPSLELQDVGRFARYLLMANRHEVFELDDILSSCPNVVHLDLFGESLWKHLEAVQHMRLTRLSAILRNFPMNELLTPTFLNLTHLDAIDSAWYSDRKDGGDDKQWDKWDGHWAVLAALPKLTHLSISDCHIALVPNLLSHCRQLQLLLVHDREDGSIHWPPKRISDMKDGRLVLMMEVPIESLQQELVNGNKGKEMDFWVTAELFATARKSEYLVLCDL